LKANPNKTDGPAETPAFLTPEEAARHLCVHRETIYMWIKRRKIKAIRFGRSWRIPRSVLQEDHNDG
jgi:excisionase family DNA binding protein